MGGHSQNSLHPLPHPWYGIAPRGGWLEFRAAFLLSPAPLQPRLDPARLEKMRGEIFVRIFVEVPTRLTDRQRQILEECADETDTEVSPVHRRFVDKLRDFFD